MSHSQGRIRFKDGTIKYVEYSGTADVLQPKIFNTENELLTNWRTTNWPTCSCKNLEPIEIAVTYGGGFGWNGFACLIHNCVRSPLSPEYIEGESLYPDLCYYEGLPSWYPGRKLYIDEEK